MVTGTRVACLLLVASLCASCVPSALLRETRDVGDGLLFYASFDRGHRAEHAVGRDLPYLARFRDPLARPPSFRLSPGAFGHAITGVAGSFDALGNVLPERGTIALHVRHSASADGFEPLKICTVDRYYAHCYLRLSYWRRRLMAWVPDSLFRPLKVPVPPDLVLPQGRWIHLAVVWDQALGMILYVDGEAVSSSWGRQSWTSRGVDPDRIALAWRDGVEYDELHIFDRPLDPEQVRQLARTNRRPQSSELPPFEFGPRHRANRLRELAWTGERNDLPAIRLGGTGASIRQIAPERARSLKRDAGRVLDGKLGEGWPSPPGYSDDVAAGLSVHVEKEFDLMTLEGRFHGRVYAGRHLSEPTDQKPLHRIETAASITRWRLPRPRRGWITFFRDRPESQRNPTRVLELGFFRLGSPDRPGSARRADARARRLFLGPAAADSGRGPMGVEIVGRFGPGDRGVLQLRKVSSSAPGGQPVPGLRFRHLVIPAQRGESGLKALRLVWWLRGEIEGNAVRIEVRDPAIPGRRLLSTDFALQPDGDSPIQRLELMLDLADRIVPADRPLWIAFAFRHDVSVLWDGGARQSYLELLEADPEQVRDEYVRKELVFAKTVFRALTEDRPWVSFEHPERDLVAFNRAARELFASLTSLWQRARDDPRVRALWYWTHKRLPLEELVHAEKVPGHAGAPRWALLQRELVRRARGVLYWWIENRQVESGEFGDGWGDDTDLIQNVPALALLGDPDGRLATAARALAEGVFSSGRMRSGINARLHRPLHAYEEGLNAQLAMALIDYGDPIYLERLMRATRTVEDHLTAVDSRGRRRFRSSEFSATEVRERGGMVYDSPNNAVFMHPALTLAYYARNPRAIRLAGDWIDGWLDYYREAEETGAHPAGRPYPLHTTLDGRVLAWDTKARGYGYVDVYAALHALTGDARYREAQRYWTGDYAPRWFMRGNSAALPALEFIDRVRYRTQLIDWARDVDLSHASSDRLNLVTRQRYMEWELTGAEGPVYDGLEAAIRNLRLLYPAYTWAEPIDDRIWLPFAPASMMAQGGMPYVRNQLWPRHYLSYEGFSDLTAWVLAKSDTSLRVWLYSFAGAVEQGRVRVWRTPLGDYRVGVGDDRDADGHADAPTVESRVLHRFSAIPVTLAPGKLVVLTLDLERRSPEDFWRRPDVAVTGEIAGGRGRGLRIRVHNLGGGIARNVDVVIRTPSGRVLATDRIARLGAPLDLVPRTHLLEFRGLPDVLEVIVEVDSEQRIAEINEENNRRVISLRAAQDSTAGGRR